jgi:hypothetical protein
MDARDLRLGNFVLVENDYEEVVGINSHEIVCRLDKISYGITQNIKDIKPIPLTKEWLDKFDIFIHKRKVPSWSDFIYIGKLEYGVNDDGCPYGIEYVHKLQNLYFSLTGEELTIKTT